MVSTWKQITAIITEGNITIILITGTITVIYFDVETVSGSLITMRQMQECGLLVFHLGPFLYLVPRLNHQKCWRQQINTWCYFAQSTISHVAQTPSTSATLPLLQ